MQLSTTTFVIILNKSCCARLHIFLLCILCIFSTINRTSTCVAEAARTTEKFEQAWTAG
jgi:hypothetical protein